MVDKLIWCINCDIVYEVPQTPFRCPYCFPITKDEPKPHVSREGVAVDRMSDKYRVVVNGKPPEQKKHKKQLPRPRPVKYRR